jgi:hypothetical protein
LATVFTSAVFGILPALALRFTARFWPDRPGWLCFPAANPKVTSCAPRRSFPCSLIRDELVMLRRLASDRRVASILLPVLRRSGLAASRAGSAPKPTVAG